MQNMVAYLKQITLKLFAINQTIILTVILLCSSLFCISVKNGSFTCFLKAGQMALTSPRRTAAWKTSQCFSNTTNTINCI